jgi:hypothetical protein
MAPQLRGRPTFVTVAATPALIGNINGFSIAREIRAAYSPAIFMDTASQSLPSDKRSKPRLLLSEDAVANLLWECIRKAFARAFLIQILGGVAIGLLGHVFKEMTPSLPPVVSHASQAKASPSPFSHAVGAFVSKNEFWIIFCLLFIAMAGARVARYSRNSQHRRLLARLLRINRRMSKDWFSLFVVNGFTAWASAMVFMIVQQFSWTQMFWNVSAVFHSLFQALANLVPGAGPLGRWYSWYGQNQAKFLFWLLYSAAICDDLGLPNYKTLIIGVRHRLKSYAQKRFAPVVAEP